MSFYSYKTKEITDKNGFRIVLHDCMFGLGDKNYRGVKLRIFWKGLYYESAFDRDHRNNEGKLPIRVWAVIRYIRTKMIFRQSGG